MSIRTLILPLTFALSLGCYDKDESVTSTGDDIESSGQSRLSGIAIGIVFCHASGQW